MPGMRPSGHTQVGKRCDAEAAGPVNAGHGIGLGDVQNHGLGGTARLPLLWIAATCGLPPESSCRLGGLEFSLVDTAGIAHNPRLLMAGVAEKFEGSEFFGGATKQGYLIFEVEGEPADYVLKYEALFGGEAYLRLE